MNYNSHTRICLKNKSNSLYTSFNFACFHYIKICIGSIYALSCQAGTKKKGTAGCLCVCILQDTQQEEKKNLHLCSPCQSSCRNPKWPLHMLFQMTETISFSVLLNNSLVCNTNIPCPSVSLQY